MQHMPLARKDDLLVEEIGAELVLYDRVSKVAHCLSADAAAVWRSCDGELSQAEIAVACGLSEAVVSEVLVRLEGMDLLVGIPQANVSRRVALKRFGKVGAATAVAVPLMLSVAVPPASASASTCSNFGAACQAYYYSGLTCFGPPTYYAGCDGGCICGGLGSCVALGSYSFQPGTCG
jgi:hypothetical protein